MYLANESDGPAPWRGEDACIRIAAVEAVKAVCLLADACSAVRAR